MRRASGILLIWLLVTGVSAMAQDGVLGSAETINPGNFKILAHPVWLLEGDSDLGMVLRGGYGVWRGMDVELKLAFFDGMTFLGADAEFWLLRGPLDLSVSTGLHWARASGGIDRPGIDLVGTVSGEIRPNLEIYGALDWALDFPEGPVGSRGRLLLVPGIEYRLSKNIDLLLELGLGLDSDARDYISGGVAYYIR